MGPGHVGSLSFPVVANEGGDTWTSYLMVFCWCAHVVVVVVAVAALLGLLEVGLSVSVDIL